jgi:hypothetical protein
VHFRVAVRIEALQNAHRGLRCAMGSPAGDKGMEPLSILRSQRQVAVRDTGGFVFVRIAASEAIKTIFAGVVATELILAWVSGIAAVEAETFGSHDTSVFCRSDDRLYPGEVSIDTRGEIDPLTDIDGVRIRCDGAEDADKANIRVFFQKHGTAGIAKAYTGPGVFLPDGAEGGNSQFRRRDSGGFFFAAVAGFIISIPDVAEGEVWQIFQGF